MKRKFGIVATVCFALALCFALAGCGGVDKSLYTGTWTMESSTNKDLDAESIALMKTLGLDVTLSLGEDETGWMNMFGKTVDVTWKAESNTEGQITINGAEAALSLADEKLTVAEEGGDSMTFAKASAEPSEKPATSVANTAAASSTSAANATTSENDAETDAADNTGDEVESGTDADTDAYTDADTSDEGEEGAEDQEVA